MKSTIKLSRLLGIFSLTFVILTTGCKEDDDPADPVNNEGSMTAQIDGTGWEADTSPANLVSVLLSNGTFNLQGQTNDGEVIRITISVYEGARTYNMGGLGNTANIGIYINDPTGNPQGWSSFAAGDNTGQLIVETDDGVTVTGRFNFEGVGGTPVSTKIISAGEFTAKY